MRLCRLRIALALLVLLTLVGLTPLGYASPPDPSWVQGIYDDADYDDVVVMVTSAVAVNAPILLVDLSQTLPPVGLVSQFADDPVAAHPISPLQPRAPPVS